MTLEERANFSIEELKFCIIDLETTGGHHLYDKIIEVGLVHLDGTDLIDKKNWIVNPEIPIPEYVQKLTSLTHEVVKDGKKIEECIDEIMDFIGDRILVAHNSSFDIPFLNSVLRRLGRTELPNRSICTHLMTKYLIPGLLNTNLQYMCRIFNIPQGHAHRALDDALAAGHLLTHYLHIFREKKIKKVNQLYYPRLKFELDRKNFPREEISEITRYLKTCQHHVLLTFKGEEGRILFSLPFHASQWSSLSTELAIFYGENCQGITLKLFGSWVEAFLHFSHHYIKLSAQERQLSFRLMAKVLFVHKSFHVQDFSSDSFSNEFQKEHHEYIVLPHLVPEQLVVLPLNNIFQRTALVFRYPGHKKKFSQFMNSRANKTKVPHQKNPLLRECENFLFTYLSLKKEERKIFYLSGENQQDQKLKNMLHDNSKAGAFYDTFTLIGPNQTQPLPGLLDEWLQIWSHAPFPPGTNYPVVHL
jgi:DNA polymerase III subunit epsilon